MAVKTAQDLPVGAEVQTFWATWTKTSRLRSDCWANGVDDRFTNEEIDDLLGRGGMLTRVPTGPDALRTELDTAELDAKEQQ